MASMTMAYGVSAVLTANAFTRDGYVFAGWSTAADGSGTGYADRTSVENLTSVDGAAVTLDDTLKTLLMRILDGDVPEKR